MITIKNANAVLKAFGGDMYRVKNEIAMNLCGQFITYDDNMKPIRLKPMAIEHHLAENTFTIDCVKETRIMVASTKMVQKEDFNGNPINEWKTFLFMDTTYLRNDD